MKDEIRGIPTLYRGVQFRSRSEARWASFFDELSWPLVRIDVGARRGGLLAVLSTVAAKWATASNRVQWKGEAA